MLYLLSIVFSHENISFIGAHIFDFLCIGATKVPRIVAHGRCSKNCGRVECLYYIVSFAVIVQWALLYVSRIRNNRAEKYEKDLVVEFICHI